MSNDVVGKWGAIGLIAGGAIPYIVGGWLENYSLLTAFGGAFLFAHIAYKGEEQGADRNAGQYKEKDKEK
jgi:hypothetical protein